MCEGDNELNWTPAEWRRRIVEAKGWTVVNVGATQARLSFLTEPVDVPNWPVEFNAARLLLNEMVASGEFRRIAIVWTKEDAGAGDSRMTVELHSRCEGGRGIVFTTSSIEILICRVWWGWKGEKREA